MNDSLTREKILYTQLSVDADVTPVLQFLLSYHPFIQVEEYFHKPFTVTSNYTQNFLNIGPISCQLRYTKAQGNKLLILSLVR